MLYGVPGDKYDTQRDAKATLVVSRHIMNRDDNRTGTHGPECLPSSHMELFCKGLYDRTHFRVLYHMCDVERRYVCMPMPRDMA
jgi:hypothetical protein